jgi:formylglycine-generating enzyme required for sulfatase activity
MTVGPGPAVWTGREARFLRQAMRLSVRAFAEYLGVDPRTISKWESSGTSVRPRPEAQAVLDTALERTPQQTTERFHSLAVSGRLRYSPTRSTTHAPLGPDTQAGHIVHVGDSKHMVQVGHSGSLRSADAGPHDDFFMDVTPVTNDEYSSFVEATGAPAPIHWENGNYPTELADHPVTYVTHRQATAYASWTDKELPSTNEWELAAAGPGCLRHPWGDVSTVMKCNVRESGLNATTPVRQYHSGISYYGVYDLAGNAWEWCRTSTEPDRFAPKGSAFTSPLAMAAIGETNDAREDMRDDDTGFRCVWRPNSPKR